MNSIPFKRGMPLIGYDPIFVFDCDALRDIFEKQHRFFKKSPDYTTLKLTLGNGLLTNDGPTWKPMSQLIQPGNINTRSTP